MVYSYFWYMTNNRDYRFESYEFAKQNGFKISDYDLAMNGVVSGSDPYEALENLFMLMNRSQSNHPGIRSMSVSDIVLLGPTDSEGGIEVYYCDDAGWTRLDFWEDM